MATKEERRAAMPVASELWDAITEHFGLPEWFTADEGGQSIRYKTNAAPSNARTE